MKKLLAAGLAALALGVGAAQASATPIQSNWNFATSVSNYGGFQGTLTWEAADATSSAGKAKVMYGGSGGYYTLQSSNWTAAAQTYNAYVRVRPANSQSAGRAVILKIREKTPGGALVRDLSSPVTPLPPYGAGEWSDITVSMSPPTAGNKLDVRLSAYGNTSGASAVAGDGFVADWMYGE